MKNSKRIIVATTMVASLGLVAMPAMAASANAGSCLSAAKEVRTALSENHGSANYDAAKKMQRVGLQYCNTGLFKQGMSRYSAALTLLGASKSASTTSQNNG
jgi:hypothetical protein